MELTTTDLLRKLTASDNRESSAMLRRLAPNNTLPPLGDFLTELAKRHDKTVADLFAHIGLERTFGTKVLKGERRCGRNVLLRIALLLNLPLEEAQRLLRVGQKARLDPRIRRDAVIIYALAHQKGIDETDGMLEAMGERNLYEKF